jgi:hypothetical protein
MNNTILTIAKVLAEKNSWKKKFIMSFPVILIKVKED